MSYEEGVVRKLPGRRLKQRALAVALFSLAVQLASGRATAAQPGPAQPAAVRPQGVPLALNGVQIESVLDRGAVDGREAQIWAISSAEPVSALVARIADSWRQAGAGQIRVDQRAGWAMLSRLDGRAVEVVQIRAGRDDSSGFIVRWQGGTSGAAQASRLNDFIPRASQVVHRSSSTVASATTWSVIAISPQPVDVVLDEVRKLALGRGLRAADVPARHALRYTASGGDLFVTTQSRGEDTLILAHFTEAAR